MSHNISILTLFFSRWSQISLLICTKLWSFYFNSSATATKVSGMIRIVDEFPLTVPICKRFVFSVSLCFNLVFYVWFIFSFYLVYKILVRNSFCYFYSPFVLLNQGFSFFSALWNGRSSYQRSGF